jgi:hypothetical protein
MATSTLGSGTLVLAGTTSGTTTVTATAVAGTTTLTLPAATDTLVGKATTDTLTNKTLTGAAMNGTLGATTPSTVAATSISASTTLGVTGVSTLTGGAVIEGMTVGKGAGAVATNTAVGANALQANTSGASNVAIGGSALFSNTASSSTAVGYQAGYSNTIAGSGVYIGAGAGYTNVGGGGNTFVGANAGNLFTAASGATYNAFFGAGSGSAITSGQKNSIFGGYSGNSGVLDIRTASNYIVLSDGDGNARGYFTNAGAFHVPTMSVGGTANLHWSSGSGQFFVTSSSRRFKHDIVDYDKGLAELMQMQPKYFVYNDEPNQKQRAGFIAEDFHDLGMTEYVEYWKDDEGNDTPSEIGYSNMVAILVKSIQELKAEVDSLKAQINGASA